MKTGFKIVISAALMSMFLSGCQVYSYEERGSRNIEPQHQVVTVPIVADVELLSTEKITYSETFTNVRLKDLDAYKYTTQARALKQYEADFLIGAIFDVNYTNKKDQLEVIVTGYPARYKEFRKATPEDQWFINKND